MSKRVGNIVILCQEPDRKCDLCGKIAETRPYGPRGENICYDCGMKNSEVTNRQMNRVLFGEDEM
jgi:hypothetical protein